MVLFQMSVRVAKLGVTLVEGHLGIIQAEIERLSLNSSSVEGSTHASGTLEKVAVTDLTPEGALYRDVFQTTGYEALTFSFKQRSTKDPLANFHPIEVGVKMASVHIIYTNRFIARLNAYINRFQEIQKIVKEKAQGIIAGLEESRMHLKVNVEIDRPVFVIPKNSFSEHLWTYLRQR